MYVTSGYGTMLVPRTKAPRFASRSFIDVGQDNVQVRAPLSMILGVDAYRATGPRCGIDRYLEYLPHAGHAARTMDVLADVAAAT